MKNIITLLNTILEKNLKNIKQLKIKELKKKIKSEIT